MAANLFDPGVGYTDARSPDGQIIRYQNGKAFRADGNGNYQYQQGPGDNPLGFPTGAGKYAFDQNPTEAFQQYINKLGGSNSPLGRYAAKRFNDVYGQYMQAAMNNPNLVFTDWLNQYANGGQLTKDYQQASPFNRDPYNQPQWAASRFLG